MKGSGEIARVPEINLDRLWRNLEELGSIGRTPEGIKRIAYSPSDMEGRRWLMRKMESAGLAVRMDEVGNVFARLESSPDRPAILVGSHIDTVPGGGMFDGALGVLAALECVQTMLDRGIRPGCPIEIAAFADEEGTQVGAGTFGSRAFAEGISDEEYQIIKPLLEQAGLNAACLYVPGHGLPPRLSVEKYRCYLELHVEQGGVLEQFGDQIGVVQGIVSIKAFNVEFQGEANHAGTTPMALRKDALLGASELVLDIPQVVERCGSGTSVGTCGRLAVFPGGRNVIPGRVEMSVEVRDMDPTVVSELVRIIEDRASAIARKRGLSVAFGSVSSVQGVGMDPAIQDTIEDVARELRYSHRRMPSGAGHDCMVLAKRMPAGMIFVPSAGGISHSPREWTHPEDCARGARVLLGTILRLAQ